MSSLNGTIHVFERFEQADSAVEKNDVRGEKWNTLSWDWAAPTFTTQTKATWSLKCDWRMPYKGSLLLPHPTDDTKNLEFAYDLPYAVLEKYTPGVLNKPAYFTPALKAEIAALPAEQTLMIGDRVSLVLCKEDIVDTCECSIDGRLYMYRAVELLISKV